MLLMPMMPLTHEGHAVPDSSRFQIVRVASGYRSILIGAVSFFKAMVINQPQPPSSNTHGPTSDDHCFVVIPSSLNGNGYPPDSCQFSTNFPVKKHGIYYHLGDFLAFLISYGEDPYFLSWDK